MTNNKQRKIILIVGKTGSGKSHLVKYDFIPHLKRIIVLDLMNEYDLTSFVVINDIESLKDYLVENADNKILRVVVRLESMEEYETAFHYANVIENMYVLIEEISNFASPHNYTPILEKLIRFGRHKSTSIIGITQRICDCGALLLNNADMLISFNLTDKNDIERLRTISYIGDKADDVSRLKGHNFLVFANQ